MIFFSFNLFFSSFPSKLIIMWLMGFLKRDIEKEGAGQDPGAR